MKNLITKSSIIILLITISYSLQSFTYDKEVFSAKMLWMETQFDFGSIEKGTPVSHDFTFSNNGDAPLLINNVKTSCGCTVSSYPKDPIMPGDSELIKVTYNAAKAGSFTKNVTVFSNTNTSTTKLIIKGEVSPV
jgi:hypothetical protein